jgi:uncharacterized protein YjiS (DUF1127 family)
LVHGSASVALHKKELSMISQPIKMFEDLTTETVARGNGYGEYYGFAHADHGRLDRETRFARVVFVVDGVVWLARLVQRAVAAVKADFKLRAAEAQLYRMTDRELADLGLSRGDIHFAVRETVEGVMPQFDAHLGHVTPANQNMRRAA